MIKISTIFLLSACISSDALAAASSSQAPSHQLTPEQEKENWQSIKRKDGPLYEIYKNKYLKRAAGSPSLLMTKNNYGNIVIDNGYFMNLFRENVTAADKILEIGSARGLETMQMLLRGATVTAVDISEADMLKAKKYIASATRDPSVRSRVKYVLEAFPKGDYAHSEYDKAIMSHVAHYLTGPELREGIGKIFAALKPGGQFFFQTLTPYADPYFWNILQAEHNKETNVEWPSYFSAEENLSYVAEGAGMPSAGHPIFPYIIERELRRAGFVVDHINYSSVIERNSKTKHPVTYQQLEAYVKQEGTEEFLRKIEEKYRARGASDLLETVKNTASVYKLLKWIKANNISPTDMDRAWRQERNRERKTQEITAVRAKIRKEMSKQTEIGKLLQQHFNDRVRNYPHFKNFSGMQKVVVLAHKPE